MVESAAREPVPVESKVPICAGCGHKLWSHRDSRTGQLPRCCGINGCDCQEFVPASPPLAEPVCPNCGGSGMEPSGVTYYGQEEMVGCHVCGPPAEPVDKVLFHIAEAYRAIPNSGRDYSSEPAYRLRQAAEVWDIDGLDLLAYGLKP